MNAYEIEKEIAYRKDFLAKLHQLSAIGDEFNAACAAEIEAANRRNTARTAYLKCWAEIKYQFPDRQLPFFDESIWGPEPDAA